MTNLRQAAEIALKVLEEINEISKPPMGLPLPAEIDDAMETLRQALDLQTERGTKAWADVPSASEWVDELRGNVDNVDIFEKRVHKTDKSIHEPVAIVNAGMGGIEWLIEQLPDDTPLYAEPKDKNT